MPLSYHRFQLGKSGEIDQEIASIWAEEAQLRDREMDSGKLSGISADLFTG